MIPQRAAAPDLAVDFLEFLLSAVGNLERPAREEAALRAVDLKPALLAALDRYKRSLFISRGRETFASGQLPWLLPASCAILGAESDRN